MPDLTSQASVFSTVRWEENGADVKITLCLPRVPGKRSINVSIRQTSRPLVPHIHMSLCENVIKSEAQKVPGTELGVQLIFTMELTLL